MIAPSLMTLQLTAILYAARDTHLFEFRRPDGGELPDTTPGSHVDLHLPNGMLRQYSLVESGTGLRRYLVGIKRDPKSRGGSLYAHEQLRVGTTLEVSAPRNNFELVDAEGPTILFAGGIGITPIWCMLQSLENRKRAWELHYACRSREDAAFLAEALMLGDHRVHLHFDQESGGVMDVAARVRAAPAGAHLYCCGPAPLLAAFEAAAEGRPADTVHVEYFTAVQEAAVAGGFVVELARSGRELPVAVGQTILDVLRTAGLEIASSCEEGVCGACETTVISGDIDHRDAILTPQERASNQTMMVCCSGCKSSRLVLDL